ncbi:MAG: hypothetical protein ACLFRG_21490 [Desulfococcaceae bacterium]
MPVNLRTTGTTAHSQTGKRSPAPAAMHTVKSALSGRQGGHAFPAHKRFYETAGKRTGHHKRNGFEHDADKHNDQGCEVTGLRTEGQKNNRHRQKNTGRKSIESSFLSAYALG